MTTLESLQGINPYPIPLRTIGTVAERYGLPLSGEATPAVIGGAPFKRACADLLRWLSMAPNITQGGQSYSFTDEQRRDLRNQADGLDAEADDSAVRTRYGYKGSRL